MAAEKRDCLICGAALKYGGAIRKVRCASCGETFDASVVCARGHYVCDACHAGGAVAAARSLCLRSDSRDPWEIALGVMRLPVVNMHGPEHHVIVGFALATAYCGALDRREALPHMLAAVESRAGKIPGGTCGYWGACGAALGAGVFLASATGATPLGGGAPCNRLTARCLNAIAAAGDVRCCKRNLGLSLRETVAFLRESGMADLPAPRVSCEFGARNRECIGSACPQSERA